MLAKDLILSSIAHIYLVKGNLTKNKFLWPGIVKALRNKYLGCSAFKVDLQSQSSKPHLVVPENLQFLVPGEQISVDFTD